MKPFSFARVPHGASNIATPMRRVRVFVIAALFLGWAALIAARLVWLQVVNHPEWVARAAQQQQRTFQVAPRRGILYDRNLHELAMTVSVDSIYAVPGEIPSEHRAALAVALASVLHTDPADHFTEAPEILKRINGSRYFTWIARKQDPSVIERLRAMIRTDGLKGVYFQKEFKRFYPENDIAAQVLGYVGVDDNGLGGVEQRYDHQLHGEPGHMLTALDARRHVLASSERDPAPGASLQLTLDANIQFMAEQALDRAMERVHPLNGTVVVQDPHTGQILALAIRPTFDPNDVKHTSPELLRNHAVSDVYEPGSTFKLVTYSAALDQKVTTPEQKIDCEGGRIVVAGRTVHDDHYNGVLTTAQALAESSDVAAIKLAERMGKDTFYSYIHAYGFGQRSGLELPGETRGLLKPPERWQPTTIGSIPMGQEVAVTPIQLVTMASTIANGGTYLPPHIVLASPEGPQGTLHPAIFRSGDGLPSPLPAGAHRVISTLASAQMRKLMEGVVLNGTGRSAQLNGYSAGGKTGTAQKIDVRTHTYSKTKYIASFVGFAPINNPAVTIAVIMDSPTEGGHHGAQASAPVFQDLAQQVLEYLGVPHDQPLATPREKAENVMAASRDTHEDVSEPVGDLNGLFADLNSLPADDPLRHPLPAAAEIPTAAATGTSLEAQAAAAGTPAGTAPPAPSGTSLRKVPLRAANLALAAPATSTQVNAPVVQASDGVRAGEGEAGSVRQAAGPNVAVPDFIGATVRAAMEKAGAAGLGVEIIGSGLARAQAPIAGTRVPSGTEIVVRFTR